MTAGFGLHSKGFLEGTVEYRGQAYCIGGDANILADIYRQRVETRPPVHDVPLFARRPAWERAAGGPAFASTTALAEARRRATKWSTAARVRQCGRGGDRARTAREIGRASCRERV